MQLLAVVEQRLGQVAPHFLQIVVARQDVDYFHRWLDENLPEMVENLVKAEIARIAGKQR